VQHTVSRIETYLIVKNGTMCMCKFYLVHIEYVPHEKFNFSTNCNSQMLKTISEPYLYNYMVHSYVNMVLLF
jgi:hypothetical protein